MLVMNTIASLALWLLLTSFLPSALTADLQETTPPAAPTVIPTAAAAPPTAKQEPSAEMVHTHTLLPFL